MTRFNVCTAFLIALVLVAGGCSVALAQGTDATTVAPGITPASPFHIFERFGDWARLNVLTFNAIRKAEVQSQIAEKRLAELKAVVESGGDSATTDRAEVLYKAGLEATEARLKALDDQGRNVADLTERFNELSLRHQAVLGRVLEKAPEQAKDAIKRALDTSNAGLTQATEVAAHQFEKGNLSEERTQKIIKHATDQLESEIAHSQKNITDLKARGETVPQAEQDRLGQKIRQLENHLVGLESRKEFKEIRQEIRADITTAARKTLEARQIQGIRDTAAEDSLRAIQSDQFDPEIRAKRMIAAAGELIAQLERKIKEAEAASKEIPEKVKVHARIASEHLTKAKAAFEAKDFGEAFGQANSSMQNAKAALSYFDNLVRVPVSEPTGRICAQVITPARNIVTQKCEVFANACLPEGWKADSACSTGAVPTAIQQIFPQPIPKPAGVAPEIQHTWTVKITDEGFFPNELTIKKGDAVIWINGGSRPHWPASAIHPTHSLYPEKGGCIGSAFDACRGLETGEKFEFKFTIAGAWKYHDHMNAGLFGAIIVQE